MDKNRKRGGGAGASPGNRITERIKSALPSMPPSSKKIALYLLENIQAAAFSPIRDLGKSVGVSEASIVRFVQGLGFEGYIDFRHALGEDIKDRLGAEDKIVLSDLNLLTDEKRLRRMSENELQNLKATLDGIDLASIRAIVEGVTKAKKIFVSGFGASANMMRILEYGLLSLRWKDVATITGSISDYYSRLCSFTGADALILITFPPYSREALQVMAHAKKAGGKAYLLTDSPRCPAYCDAEATIFCQNNSLLLTNSYVGLVAVIQVLINMLALKDKKKAASGIREVIRGEREAYQEIARMKADDNRWADEEDLPLE
jgi:Transcriptional regulators